MTRGSVFIEWCRSQLPKATSEAYGVNELTVLRRSAGRV